MFIVFQQNINLKKKFDYKNLVAYEKKCCKKFGSILFCTDDDLMRVIDKKSVNSHVVPNIFSRMVNDKSIAEVVSEHHIIFVGALN